MAFLKKLDALPSQAEAEFLRSVDGACELWVPKTVLGESLRSVWIFNERSKFPVMVCSDYYDVRFKFECPYLKIQQKRLVEAKPVQELGQPVEMATVTGVKLAVRAEWERWAAPTEVQPGYEQVVTERGSLADIPAESPACVAVCGVLSLDSAQCKQVLIYLDDSFPLTVSVTSQPENIKEVLVDASLIQISDLDATRRSLADWEKPK